MIINLIRTIILPLFLITIFFSAYSQDFDLQGHRGARGLLPENSIPGFIRALDLGVTTLEMDVVITADGKVLVSHEAYISANICLDSSGQNISKGDEKSLNIFQMTYEETQAYDCGTKHRTAYPEQENLRTTKPLLVDVISASEDHINSSTGYKVSYNIEIKSGPESDNIYHPEAKEFSDLVYAVIDNHLPWGRVNIQSFDTRVLRYFHKNYEHVTLAYLVERNTSVDENLNELGFIPDIYSPAFQLLNNESVNHIHDLGMKVIPWTVNKISDIERIRNLGVDGLITDYPDRAKELGLTVEIPYRK